MSLTHLANTCSHLQNASRARLSLTSIPNSRILLSLSLALQNSGFLSTVVRGGPTPPPPHPLLSHPRHTYPASSIPSITPPPPPPPPSPSSSFSSSTIPAQSDTPPPETSQTSSSSSSSSSYHPTSTPEEQIEWPLNRTTISRTRLWLGLKYWNSEPVLSHLSLISKPTRRIWMDTQGLKRLVLGKPSGMVKGMTRPGECVYVSTDRGILEARECVERKVGGMLLCRVR